MPATSDLKDVIIAYKKLSFSDQAAFYAMVPNDFCLTNSDIQSFLIETRITEGHGCIYCGSSHVVKNGKRKDGTQRFLCRDCKKSFLPNSESVTSRTRKNLTVWTSYLNCMLDKKTLQETSRECGISMSTAFSWRHKSEAGFSYARPAKTGKVSSASVKKIFDGVIAPDAVLCTDNEKAYMGFARDKGIRLVQMETDSRVTKRQGRSYGIQRINAYHSRLKGFIQRFHGVSTKYLENYLIWNDVLANSQGNREELLELLLSEILTARISLRSCDIPHRPPLPVL